jgi:Uma2 family endonuclease
VSIAPDLVVEVISPTNKAGAVETKILEYLEAGVKLVWVVFPQSRTIHVRRAEGTLRVVREHEQLDRESLLPGFSCSVRDLFPQ